MPHFRQDTDTPIGYAVLGYSPHANTRAVEAAVVKGELLTREELDALTR